MKKNNKKGFTIVELVIVIAVIAILSAVLIPTFGGIIDQANESSRDQKAKNALTNYMITADAEDLADGVNGFIVIEGYYYVVTDNNLVDIDEDQDDSEPTGYTDYDVLVCDTCNLEANCEDCGNTAPSGT